MVGAFRIRELLDSQSSPWTGHRILCFGEYNTVASFPGFVAKIIVKQKKQSQNFKGSFYDFVAKTYKEQRISRKGRWHDVITDLEKRSELAGLSATDRCQFNEFVAYLKILSTSQSRKKMEKSAVLCNLSQHKYVRGSAVQEKFERHRLSISHLLLAHICWSTEPVSQMKDATCSVTRSPWVGSRFEITTMDKLRPDIEWKDVTEAAMERLTDLWEGTDQ